MLGIAVVAYAAGELAGFPVLRALAGAAAGADVAALVIVARRPRVTVAREVYPDRVQRGRPAFARLRVHNAGTRRQSGFIAGDRLAGGFHAVAVRTLAPGAEAVYHYELPTTSRGRFQVGPLTLERVDPLGLGRSRLTTGDTATLWVYPRSYPVRALVVGPPRHHHEGRTTADSRHGSLDLRDVREYVPGDEVRHLHWKATAKTGRLMVRDYVDPNQPRFTVLLDTRGELAPPPVLEQMVDLAGSLVTAAAGAGHRCRLVTSGEVDLGVRGGPPAVRELLDELCELTAAEGTGLPLVPPSLTRAAGRGGALAVLLAGAWPQDLAALAALRPHYSTMVVIGLRPGVDLRVPGVRVLLAKDAKEAANRWNVVVA